MGAIKGSKEYKKFKEGKPLTRKQAISAHCYECNGLDEGREDCKGYSCPFYQFYPYRQGKGTDRPKKSKCERENGSFVEFQDKRTADVEPILTAS
jgi:hypothetical protein